MGTGRTITYRTEIAGNCLGILAFVLAQCITACSVSIETAPPPEDRFRKVILSEDDPGLQGAIQFDFAPDGRIYLIHLSGHLKIFDTGTRKFITAGKFDGGEYGLIGMKLDPQFEKKPFIYLQYFIADTGRGSDGSRRRIMKISRFTFQNDSLIPATEKNYLQIPYEHQCCHTGGGMDFDSKGNLYISTGDNTGAFFTQYSPTVQLPGHLIDDGLRSAGNTNDYRGKILRIHPNDDGSYSVPQDNLFAEGTPGARPEIYIMGLRNPYRLYIDKRTDFLYWGEVGPDAAKDSTAGPKGYDEFNQARKAGNFGWPLVIADNQAYSRVEYVEQKEKGVASTGPVKEKFDTLHPLNFSFNNTGLKELPPTQRAFIWYPYDSSQIFPLLGLGGRTAIAGPVYTYDRRLKSPIKFPAYFDRCWFIADWMRDWLKIARLDKNSDLTGVEDFLTGMDFNKPIFLRFGPDGALYLLEYGTTWSASNDDIRLVRIEYISGNRPPVAVVKAEKLTGGTRPEMRFSAALSFDYDGDDLQYTWKDQQGKVVGREQEYTALYEKPGKYAVRLEVHDPHGGSDMRDTTIWAGDVPEAKLWLPNRTFYGDSIVYDFRVQAQETAASAAGPDGQGAKVFLQYLPADLGKTGTNAAAGVRGEVLLNESDCMACHHTERSSVGPSLKAIAERYGAFTEQIPRLAEKIIKGGSGVWGNNNMSAHPQLSEEQAMEMVKYIYTLRLQPGPRNEVPPRGSVNTRKAMAGDPGGYYKLVGNYADDTGQFSGFTVGDSVMLRSAVVKAADFDGLFDAELEGQAVTGRSFSYASLKQVDLTSVNQARVTATGPIEIRVQSEKGPLIGKAAIPEGREMVSMTIDLQETQGLHDIFFVFALPDRGFVLRQQLQQVEFILRGK